MNRKYILGLLSFTFTLVFLVGCYKDKEEVLYPSANTTCDTTGTMSFAQDITPIMSAHCYACHSASNYNSAGGNINLEGYSGVLQAAQNGALLKSIKHQSGASPMPRNSSKLSDCKIATIEKWINEGMSNN